MTILPFRRPETPQKPSRSPLLSIPPATLGLAGLMLLVYLLLQLLSPETRLLAVFQWALVPARLMEAPFSLFSWLPLVTHMAIHMSLGHMAMNGLMLLAFGSAAERLYGPRRMLGLFVACGLAGAALHLVFYASSTAPMLGASGGLSGLFAAVVVRLMESGQMARGRFGVWGIAAIWTGISLVMALAGEAMGLGSIAWASHVGGFLAGIYLAKIRPWRV